MAIFEKTIRNQKFNTLLRKLEQEIPDSSWSADLEAGSDFKEGEARCSVRVFERYSMMGGNRLSLTLTMFQNGDSPIRLPAIVLSVWWRETSVRFATTVAGTVSRGEWLFLFHVLIFPMMVYRIIPKTTRNRMGNRMLNSISNPA